MKILVDNSTWSNVGEAWYRFPLYYLLKNIYPEYEVIMGEGPARVTFTVQRQQQQKNIFDLMQYQKADIHIFSGPILPILLSDYKNKIVEIKKRNAQYALISISGTGLSKERINEIGNFLKEYPPLLFASRDEETYQSFSPFVKNAYNGICTSFLANKMIPAQTFQLEKPFFISSFYTELEPYYALDNGKKCSVENLQIRRQKTCCGLPYKYARHFNFLRPQQVEVGNHLIVRTIQGLNPRFKHINFAMPNSFISFNPCAYLEITNSSEFVISDRVHACATGLAYGKPVRFLFDTPRAGLFDRMGFDYKSNKGIMYPNPEKIDEEYEKLTTVIKKNI
ncbi:hypothetical protein FACS189446_1040 [Bacteroidia bacterium]|nr:hypothetical protein FACS189446_1040 [Bacteroidia bacterium]